MEARALWIGGSPCSGKTTLAKSLASTRGVPLYSCDDAFEQHATAVSAEHGPTLRKVINLSTADRLAQPIEVQVSDVFELYREEFPLILADIAAFPDALVIEGAALLPTLLASLHVPKQHAVWMVPTEDFQREHYARRAWAAALLRDTPDPEQAFDRWMQRDARYAAEIAQQAHTLGYPVIVIDGSMSQIQVAEAANEILTPLS